MGATSVSASAESITPFPVEPGQDFTVQMRVLNNGGDVAENVRANFLDTSIFYSTGNEAEFAEPFSLCGLCSRENVYYFTVPPEARSGEYLLVFEVRTDNGGRRFNVPIRVIGEPDIVFDITPIQKRVAPGGRVPVTISTRNVGTGTARNIKITPVTQGFAIEGANLVFLEELKAGRSVTRNTSLTVSDNLETRLHTVDFNVTFKDEKSVDYDEQQSAGIVLTDEVSLSLASISLNPQRLKKGEDGAVTIRVENNGEGDARNIRATLDAPLLGGMQKSFIGRLDEDEDAPAVFTVTPENTGTIPATLRVQYTDGFGVKEVVEEIRIPVEGNTRTPLYVGIGVLVLLASGVLYRFKPWRTDA